MTITRSLKSLFLSSIALFASVFALAVGAHTTVESTKPNSGAVLEHSPPKIEIKFRHTVQMTSIVVVEPDKTERKLTFTPTTRTDLITIDNPSLQVGRSELGWKALSNDGHVIGGTLAYIVKAAGTSP